MAHVEPMDVDCLDGDFDNKENSLQHNVPCTEKGYEELDVSELNMKLRYSITPSASPMSKSYTAFVDRNLDCDDSTNGNLTRSLNSSLTNDSVIKSLKTLPLQTISTDQILDNKSAVLRQLDTTVCGDNNVTITVSKPHEIDENISLPSSSSSVIHTPEATTPTNIFKTEEGSPIIRGLKSVFNMFRSSQSPIPPGETDNLIIQEVLSEINHEDQKAPAQASTPIATHRSRDGSSSKRSSPLKDSIVFNDDLEKELQWKDDTILFSEEKIPIHKLFFQQAKPIPIVASATPQEGPAPVDNLKSNVEYMDISYNQSTVHSTLTETQNITVESDSEFVDCETTFSKNESQNLEINDEPQKDPLSGTLDITKEIVNEGGYIPNHGDDVPQNLGKIDIVKENIPVAGGDEKQNTAIIMPILDITKEVAAEIVSNEINENQLPGTGADETLNVTSDNVEINENLETKEKLQKDDILESARILEVTMEITERKDNVINECDISEFTTAAIMEPADNKVSIASPIITDTTLHEPNNQEHNQILPACLQNEEVIDSIVINLNKTNENQAVTCEKNVSTSEIVLTEMIENESKEIEVANTPEIQDMTSEHEHLHAPMIEENKSNIESVAKESQNLPKTDLMPEPNKEACPPENISDKTMNEFLEKDTKIEEVTLPIDSDPMSDEILSAPSMLAEEPANIPLPDDDDIDLEQNNEVNMLKLETIQALHPDVLDTLATKTKLDEAKNLDEPISETLQENIEEVDKNHELCMPGNDLLNETNDIVNSLTEIIGESSNISKFLDLSQTQVMNDVECAEEKTVLPDVVNETIYNMGVDGEMVPQGLNNSRSVENNESDETTITLPNVPELASNITNESKTDIEISEKSVVQQSNECNNDNLERGNESIGTKEYVDFVPKEVLQVESNESENLQNEKEHIIDSIPEAESKKTTNEELVVSENNSPFVLVTTKNNTEENFEIINIPNTTQLVPSSPPIRSKGYNFNFDDMDDPFATKTKIRLSPPPAPSELDNEVKQEVKVAKKAVPNRHRSQPLERKRSETNKKKFNSTVDASRSTHFSKDQVIKTDCKNGSVDVENTTGLNDSTQILENLVGEKDIQKTFEEISAAPISTENKSSIESITNSEIKTSSSEQSTYYSAVASSSDSSHSKNVFNLPEIDDANFNPFASKSRMRQSPTLDFENENPFVTKSKMVRSPDSSMIVLENVKDPKTSHTETKMDFADKMDTELMEKDAYNVSNSTSSSKCANDKSQTTREVNTEDEDTEEGPFLEAEDAIEKTILFENSNDDMMQFNEIPPQAVVENPDDGELFIDAEAFEFLLNKNQHNVVADSGKESLFLKFDPLFSKRISSDGVLAALNKVQKRQSTPTKPIRPSLRNEASPIPGPSTLNATYDEEMNSTQESTDDLNITVAKPMMVVTPAINPAVNPRNMSITPPRSNRRSNTFISPAMAVIDRLLSLSGSFVGQQDTTITHTSRERREADIVLTQLRELLAEKEISVHQLQCESQELKDRLSNMESQVKILQKDGQDRLEKINELNERLTEKNKVNKGMVAAVAEYERTIASLIAEIEQDKKRHAEERIRLISERDEQTAHLASMEVSFSDLHSKYEKSKQLIISYKANEDTCEKSIKDFDEKLTKVQKNYELLKQHACSQLNHANQELQKINKAHESEVLKLNAMIKRKDMHVASLEETLAQKSKANQELTAICDELINKVG